MRGREIRSGIAVTQLTATLEEIQRLVHCSGASDSGRHGPDVVDDPVAEELIESGEGVVGKVRPGDHDEAVGRSGL